MHDLPLMFSFYYIYLKYNDYRYFVIFEWRSLAGSSHTLDFGVGFS